MKKRYWNMFFISILAICTITSCGNPTNPKAGVKQMQCRTNRKMQCT